MAEASVALLPSDTVKPESTVTGVEVTLSPAVNTAEPESSVSTGGTVTATVLVAARLFSLPSLTTNEIVLLPAAVLAAAEKVTASKALAHCASVADEVAEVKVSTPVEESYDAEILPKVVLLVLLNDRISPLVKPLPTETVPDAKVALSRSPTLTPPSIAVAAVPPR